MIQAGRRAGPSTLGIGLGLGLGSLADLGRPPPSSLRRETPANTQMCAEVRGQEEQPTAPSVHPSIRPSSSSSVSRCLPNWCFTSASPSLDLPPSLPPFISAAYKLLFSPPQVFSPSPLRRSVFEVTEVLVLLSLPPEVAFVLSLPLTWRPLPPPSPLYLPPSLLIRRVSPLLRNKWGRNFSLSFVSG